MTADQSGFQSGTTEFQKKGKNNYEALVACFRRSGHQPHEKRACPGTFRI
jgi:hypothetical protein